MDIWFFKKTEGEKSKSHCCLVKNSGYFPCLPGENYSNQPDYFTYVAYCGETMDKREIGRDDEDDYVVCKFQQLNMLNAIPCDVCLKNQKENRWCVLCQGSLDEKGFCASNCQSGEQIH